MKKVFFNLIAVFLMLAGGSLLVIGAMEGQGLQMMMGAALALLAGLVALLMQNGFFSQRVGTILGILFFSTFMVIAANLLTDFACRLLDPRIRAER